MIQPAFWDSSSLVPLCIDQKSSKLVRELTKTYSFTVWWATPVEMCAAFARLKRMGELNDSGWTAAHLILDRLRPVWRELQPTENLRSKAESLVEIFPLKGADALQLAAALAWCQDRPQGRPFISGDQQLLQAARTLGFQTVAS